VLAGDGAGQTKTRYFHLLGAYAADIEFGRVVGTAHGMGISGFLNLAHFADRLRRTKVLHADAAPTFLRHAGFGPLAIRGSSFDERLHALGPDQDYELARASDPDAQQTAAACVMWRLIRP
jgi:hypothetical protein